MEQNRPNRTKVNIMNQIEPKWTEWTEVERIGPMWTEQGQYALNGTEVD